MLRTMATPRPPGALPRQPARTPPRHFSGQAVTSSGRVSGSVKACVAPHRAWPYRVREPDYTRRAKPEKKPCTLRVALSRGGVCRRLDTGGLMTPASRRVVRGARPCLPLLRGHEGAQAAGAMGIPMDLSKHAFAGQPTPQRMRGWGSPSDSGDGTPGPRVSSDIAADDTAPSAYAVPCPHLRTRSGPAPPQRPAAAGFVAVTPYPSHFARECPTLASGCQDGLLVVLGGPRAKERGSRWPAGVASRWPLNITRSRTHPSSNSPAIMAGRSSAATLSLARSVIGWASVLRQTFYAFHLLLPGTADMPRSALEPCAAPALAAWVTYQPLSEVDHAVSANLLYCPNPYT